MWDGGGKQVLLSVTWYGEPYVLFSLGRFLMDGLFCFFFLFFFSVESCPKCQVLIFDWRGGKAFKTNVYVVTYCLQRPVLTSCHLRFNKT